MRYPRYLLIGYGDTYLEGRGAEEESMQIEGRLGSLGCLGLLGGVKSCVKQVPPRYTLPRLPSTPYCFTIFAVEILPRGGIVV